MKNLTQLEIKVTKIIHTEKEKRLVFVPLQYKLLINFNICQNVPIWQMFMAFIYMGAQITDPTKLK